MPSLRTSSTFILATKLSPFSTRKKLSSCAWATSWLSSKSCTCCNCCRYWFFCSRNSLFCWLTWIWILSICWAAAGGKGIRLWRWISAIALWPWVSNCWICASIWAICACNCCCASSFQRGVTMTLIVTGRFSNKLVCASSMICLS